MGGSKVVPVEIFAFIFTAALQMSNPIITEFVQHRECEHLSPAGSGLPTCQQEKDVRNTAESRTARFLLYFNLVGSILAFFTVTVLGALSDKYGRKPAMVVSSIGGIAVIGSAILVIGFDLPLWVLFIGEGLYGLCGGFALGLMCVFASVSDLSTPENRTFRVSVMEGAILGGSFTGVLAGGMLVHYSTYLVSLGVSGCLCAFGLCLVPFIEEPLALSNRRKTVTWKEANVITVAKILNRNWLLRIAGLAFVLSVTGLIGPTSVIILYTESKFGWGDGTASYYLSAMNAFRAMGLLLVLPVASRYWANHPGADTLIAIGSCLMFAVQFVLQALVNNQYAYFAVAGLGMFGVLAAPVLRSHASKQVSPSEQGAVFSAIAGIECLTPFAGAAVFNSIYSATTHSYKPAAFYGGAGLMLLAAALMLIFRAVEKRTHKLGYQPLN